MFFLVGGFGIWLKFGLFLQGPEGTRFSHPFGANAGAWAIGPVRRATGLVASLGTALPRSVGLLNDCHVIIGLVLRFGGEIKEMWIFGHSSAPQRQFKPLLTYNFNF